MTEFHGFPLFNEVANPTLRNWNRLNVLFNIKQLMSDGMSRKYAENFNKHDKIKLLTLANYVTINGYENTRREIFRKLNG